MSRGEVPPLPLPEVSNLRKASTSELAQEVITLRLYIALLLQAHKDFRTILFEMTGEAPLRLVEAELQISALSNRIYRLEMTNDERNRSDAACKENSTHNHP